MSVIETVERCPDGGTYHPIEVQITMAARTSVEFVATQMRCDVCDGRVFLAAGLQLLEAVYFDRDPLTYG